MKNKKGRWHHVVLGLWPFDIFRIFVGSGRVTRVRRLELASCRPPIFDVFVVILQRERVFRAEPFTRVFVFVRECVGDLLFQGISEGHYLAMWDVANSSTTTALPCVH